LPGAQGRGDVDTVHSDPSIARREHSEDEIDHRALAGTRRLDDAD
jgi:hypothetical protein